MGMPTHGSCLGGKAWFLSVVFKWGSKACQAFKAWDLDAWEPG